MLDIDFIISVFNDRRGARQLLKDESGFSEYTNEIHHARLDCFIFIFIVEFGWGKARTLPSGAVVAENSPVSGMRRLGYPQRYRLTLASKRVRATCPEEATNYKKAQRAWKEAWQRYCATLSEASWNWYVAGDGNKNSVAYRTKVDLRRKYGWMHFRRRRSFKYMVHELLPRTEERKRSQEEMKEAQAIMRKMRKQIFRKMNVPKKYREFVDSNDLIPYG